MIDENELMNKLEDMRIQLVNNTDFHLTFCPNPSKEAIQLEKDLVGTSVHILREVVKVIKSCKQIEVK